MQNQQQITRQEDVDLSTRLTYFLIGGTVGAVVALLFAPKSGHELRGDIADATRKGVDRTRETAGQLGAKAGEYYTDARGRAGELYQAATAKAGEVADAARDAASRKGEQLTAAIEAGRQAYTEEKRRSSTTAGELEAAPTYNEAEKPSS